jgi:hypothetical protein
VVFNHTCRRTWQRGAVLCRLRHLLHRAMLSAESGSAAPRRYQTALQTHKK